MTKTRSWRPFGARDPHEAHRVSTPLELLFDLVIVIAVASAAEGLHHAVAGGHAAMGVATFAMAFFATWWAWVNFTWFASAYDSDGPLYRLITCAIMAGALVIAGGIPRLFEGLDLSLVIVGYAVMRLGMVAFWLIAARADPRHRRTALTYAIGISVVQLYWNVTLQWLRPESTGAAMALFGLGALLELSVPLVAERRGTTPWHLHHVAERHGLLVIIVLGEVLLASANAFTYTDGAAAHVGQLVLLAFSALAITFAMWWLYFSQEGPVDQQVFSSAFRWGYAHALIYAGGAATGAGFAVVIDGLAGAGGHGGPPAPPLAGNLTVAGSLALYMIGLWFVRDRLVLTGPWRHGLLLFAAAVLGAATLGDLALPATALLTIAAVVARSRVQCRQA
ncbi:low temperature requirement protein A [Novosphingobium sp. BL-52-GroH]|uniref:low temperature requirement protein A n=1 Tax=Novosphingobium sp. BL-52-GroH TaxID=3349877 RepID=UPI00384BE49C